MSTATVFDLIIAATCFGFAWLVWSALRSRPTDTPHRPQPTATAREIDDLELLGLRNTHDGPQRSLSHRELLALAPADRRRLRDASDWRIHGFHYVNAAARRLYWDRELGALASRILRRRARPIAAINFMSGSEQDLQEVSTNLFILNERE